jgi:hypothetical protein
MKKLILLSIFLTGSYAACYGEETLPSKKTSQEISQVGVGVEVDDDDYYDDDYDDGEQQVIWIGPGLYYGLWFDNEWEYNDWYGHHHHDGHHHDGHHGGGHHGGGDGGGHGHGGHGGGGGHHH